MENYSVSMVFITDKYKDLTLTVPYCKSFLSDENIRTSMQGIIDSGILKSSNGLAVQPKKATYTITTETVLK